MDRLGKKKVFVIGSNSFSGSDFIDYLLENNRYEVYAISRSPEKEDLFLPYKARDQSVPFFQIDLNHDLDRLAALVEQYKPEYIVNFSALSEVAPSWEHPEHWFQTNVVALTGLASMLRDYKGLERFVHISSPEVYGSCEGIVKEDAALNPSTPYAASKAAGDLSLLTFFKNFNFPLVIVRSTNVYGAHQQLFKIIPRSIISLRLGKDISLHGGGTAVKSFINIRDISRGELLVMEKGVPGETYHFSPDRGISVKDVVSMICGKMGQPFKDHVKMVEERLGQDKAYIIDSTKAYLELGWEPRIQLDEGIAQTIDWVNKNYDRIQQLPLDYQHRQ